MRDSQHKRLNDTDSLRLCFVLDQPLQPYRIPLFERLQNCGYQVTVIYPKIHSLTGLSRPLEIEGESRSGYSAQQTSFQQIPVNRRIFLGLHYIGAKSLSEFDVVVVMQNLRLLDLWFLTLNPFNSAKIIHWGIGASKIKDDEAKKTFLSHVRSGLSLFASAVILYSEAPRPLYPKRIQNRLFVAHNTIENTLCEDLSGEPKDLFLFIGTLDPRKGIRLLIEAFRDYLKAPGGGQIQTLVIIGDGVLEEDLKEFVQTSGLEDHVMFTGRLEDESLKKKYFRRAAATISPLQAGLSVLESFSYGVPFITFKRAISGGEHLNVIDGETGFRVSSRLELTEKLYEMQRSPDLLRKLGRNAYLHYHNNRTMNEMVVRMEQAIEYVQKNG